MNSKECTRTCVQTSGTSSTICNEVWGDGKIFARIEGIWDDNNTYDGDGCTYDWRVEHGYVWTGGNSTTKDTWYAICGDQIFISKLEEWEDGNIDSYDGWNSLWKIESGWYWNYDEITKLSKCIEYWGDGRNFKMFECDDGNLINGDGWDSSCKIEVGYTL